MKKTNLLHLLHHWLKFESNISEEGDIYPSIMAVHVVHFYFLVYAGGENTFAVSDARMDKQGGIFVTFHQANNCNKYLFHVFMDGLIDWYEISNDGDATIQRFKLKDNKKGFGTSAYQF